MLRNFFCLCLLLLAFASCRKEEKISTNPSDKLTFSSDSVLFDTVFVTAGSTVGGIKVYNPNSKKLVISSIQLGKGQASQFRLNIDGVPGPSATNIEIAGKDSFFIFVEVTVDPNNSLSPFLITDSILFSTNGNLQDVKLVAYGQNAHYIKPTTYLPGYPPLFIFTNNVHWTDSLPYVIFGFAVVDSGYKITIDAGTRIYFHKDAGLWVFSGGSIKVNGTKDKPVTFQGDRLEPLYAEEPGQWSRIWINEGSVDNEFNYAIIKNAFIGIQAEVADGTNKNNKLILKNTIIRNMSGIGIYSTFYDIDASNTVVANCAQQLLGLSYGGIDSFTHCTFANYWNKSQRQDPSFVLNNKSSAQKFYFDFSFKNCILDGSVDEEFSFDMDTAMVLPRSYTFENCMLKTKKDVSDVNHFISVFKNQDAAFEDKTMNDYQLTNSSFAIGKGNVSIANLFPTDINGNPRLPQPDLGAYQYHP